MRSVKLYVYVLFLLSVSGRSWVEKPATRCPNGFAQYMNGVCARLLGMQRMSLEQGERGCAQFNASLLSGYVADQMALMPTYSESMLLNTSREWLVAFDRNTNGQPFAEYKATDTNGHHCLRAETSNVLGQNLKKRWKRIRCQNGWAICIHHDRVGTSRDQASYRPDDGSRRFVVESLHDQTLSAGDVSSKLPQIQQHNEHIHSSRLLVAVNDTHGNRSVGSNPHLNQNNSTGNSTHNTTSAADSANSSAAGADMHGHNGTSMDLPTPVSKGELLRLLPAFNSSCQELNGSRTSMFSRSNHSIAVVAQISIPNVAKSWIEAGCRGSDNFVSSLSSAVRFGSNDILVWITQDQIHSDQRRLLRHTVLMPRAPTPGQLPTSTIARQLTDANSTFNISSQSNGPINGTMSKETDRQYPLVNGTLWILVGSPSVPDAVVLQRRLGRAFNNSKVQQAVDDWIGVQDGAASNGTARTPRLIVATSTIGQNPWHEVNHDSDPQQGGVSATPSPSMAPSSSNGTGTVPGEDDMSTNTQLEDSSGEDGEGSDDGEASEDELGAIRRLTGLSGDAILAVVFGIVLTCSCSLVTACICLRMRGGPRRSIDGILPAPDPPKSQDELRIEAIKRGHLRSLSGIGQDNSVGRRHTTVAQNESRVSIPAAARGRLAKAMSIHALGLRAKGQLKTDDAARGCNDGLQDSKGGIGASLQPTLQTRASAVGGNAVGRATSSWNLLIGKKPSVLNAGPPLRTVSMSQSVGNSRIRTDHSDEVPWKTNPMQVQSQAAASRRHMQMTQVQVAGSPQAHGQGVAVITPGISLRSIGAHASSPSQGVQDDGNISSSTRVGGGPPSLIGPRASRWGSVRLPSTPASASASASASAGQEHNGDASGSELMRGWSGGGDDTSMESQSHVYIDGQQYRRTRRRALMIGRRRPSMRSSISILPEP